MTPALLAVRKAVADLLEGSQAVVACSGGADSLALAAAAATLPQPITAAVINHGLQPDSSQVADRAAAQCRGLGLTTEVRQVTVVGPGGPEAAARSARYAALREIAAGGPILLAHTLDDQAETVLLRLARGSGARSLAAMRPCDAPWHRPFLDIPRELVHEVASERFEPLGFTPWNDPHNHDRRFARVRVRQGLTALEQDLGPGLPANLARSARLLGDDADALDAWTAGEFSRIVGCESDSCSADIAALLELPRAVRTRVLRSMHQHVVGPHEDLSFDHIQQVEALVSRWKGQGPTRLPGGVTARVEYGRLTLLVQPREI